MHASTSDRDAEISGTTRGPIASTLEQNAKRIVHVAMNTPANETASGFREPKGNEPR